MNGKQQETNNGLLEIPNKPAANEIQSDALSFQTAPSLSATPKRKTRKLVLCFDGTGNKFHGDESDSNVLKIFRMLDRGVADQYHYYQPGIGTYVISDSLTSKSTRARISSWYIKAKDSAIGSSFDQHVVGGYRFLMRFYHPGDEIYMFGFSRGAYIARFLAEMLDHIGLLCHGNEEMVRFAWKTFAQWQCRRQRRDKRDDSDSDTEADDDDNPEEVIDEETEKLHQFMQGFRETFSRPVGRIRFLGLFDTVNSVPKFENAWMQRSKFPYTARSSARVIRHAVSIDERRAKFRQDLLYQQTPRSERPNRHHHHHHNVSQRIRDSFDFIRPSKGQGTIDNVNKDPKEANNGLTAVNNEINTTKDEATNNSQDHPSGQTGRKQSMFLSPNDIPEGQQDENRGRRKSHSKIHFMPYRPRSRTRSIAGDGDEETASCLSDVPPAEFEEDQIKPDIEEVWFAGGHGDIGGGWPAVPDRKSASHVPLAWIVREAIKAGLAFDTVKVAEMGCSPEAIAQTDPPAISESDNHNPDIRLPDGTKATAATDSPDDENHHLSPFHKLMHKAHTSELHDSLSYGGGLGFMAVTAWNIMEWLPFRRMDLQKDGSWKPIRWPLPRGEVRDIPSNIRVHGSVIRRLKNDAKYRPGNLIIGGGGRGIKIASETDGIGIWECVAEPGDPIGEVWVKTEQIN